MSTNLRDLYPDGIKINVANEEFTIKPFVLRNRMKVVKVIAEVFGAMAQGDPTLQNKDNNAVLLGFVDNAGDKLIDIYEIVLGKEKEWLLDNVQLQDEINIIKAIMDLNNIPLLLSQIQEMIKKNS